MPSEDLINLYSKRILALASDIALNERLSDPESSAKKRSPLCGSTVTVDIDLENDRISRFGQDVRACALGQASASIFARHVMGISLPELRKLREDVHAMLKADGPVPAAPFNDYEVLQPAKDYKNRHASILLVLDATLCAFEAIGGIAQDA